MSIFNMKISEQIYCVKIVALMWTEVRCQNVSLHSKTDMLNYFSCFVEAGV